MRDDLIDAFVRFHRRIEAALADLLAIVDAEHPSDAHRKTALRLVGFLSGPLVWHDHDEEVLLLPRMRRKLAGAESESLAVCGRRHDEMEQHVDAIVPRLKTFAASTVRAPAALVRRAHALNELLDDHLRLEEDEVFPLARRLMTHEELTSGALNLHARMRERKLHRARVVELPEGDRHALESAVDVAIRQAVDLARSRRSRLAGVTLAGADPGNALVALARAALARLGCRDAEVGVESTAGPVRLTSIELAQAA